MKPELRAKIIAFNRKRAEEGDKAADMDIIAGKLLALPPGQLKRCWTKKRWLFWQSTATRIRRRVYNE